MNKFILSLGILLHITSITATTDQEIRKNLEFLYDNYAINYTQLAENNISLLEVIDRNIAIMEQHKVHLQSKINRKKGFFAQTLAPLSKTITAFSLGGISLWFGLLAPGNQYLPAMIPFFFGISSLLAGGTALKFMISRYKHFSNIEKSIKKWKAQIIKDSAIIATLKELKYQF